MTIFIFFAFNFSKNGTHGSEQTSQITRHKCGFGLDTLPAGLQVPDSRRCERLKVKDGGGESHEHTRWSGGRGYLRLGEGSE